MRTPRIYIYWSTTVILHTETTLHTETKESLPGLCPFAPTASFIFIIIIENIFIIIIENMFLFLHTVRWSRRVEM